MKHTWYALCVLRMLMLYSMYVSVVQLLCHQHDLDSYNYHTVWCYCILGIMEVWAFFLTLSPKKKPKKKTCILAVLVRHSQAHSVFRATLNPSNKFYYTFSQA